ncbi:MAG: pyridoxamine 5'-phosphate oxidase family protein [Pseudomonadota bacterium]
MAENKKTILDTDDTARKNAKAVIDTARFGALAVVHPQTGHPHVTRISIASLGGPVTLISDLSLHTKALRANPNAALLLGEPEPRGDPLTYPRITLSCTAHFVTRKDADYIDLRDAYLAQNPKSKLYIDFTDFNFVRFEILSADLNAGFGKAYHLTAANVEQT